MTKCYDEVPEFLIEWIKKQHMFWVASAPLNPGGHVNVSPKGPMDSFHIVNSRQVWYEDQTGSGVETISHIRENGRITVMFQAFDGPPRILRLYGTGTVHEFGTQEYESFIPPETRKSGSRSAIVIDVYKCATSCGFGVPIYEFVTNRTQLLRISEMTESKDRPSGCTTCTEINPMGLKAYWIRENARSLDGLPGLLTAHNSEVIPVGVFDKDSPRPKLHRSSSRLENTPNVVTSGSGNLVIGFALGALAATLIHRILLVSDVRLGMFTS